MNARDFFVLFALPFLLLTACGSKELDRIVSGGGKQMKADEIQSVFVGSKVHLLGYNEDASLVFHFNGKISAENKEGEKNDGVWGIDNQDNFCLKFKRWGGGDKICYSVYQLNNEYSFFQKSSKRYDVTITTKNFDSATTQSSQKPHGARTNQLNHPKSLSETVVIQEEKIPTAITPQAKKEIGLVVRDLAKNCPGCNLMKANLAGADLSHANLAGANLAEADLRYANLRRANLKGANLYNADLTGADLKGAQMDGANLQGVVGLP